MAGKCKATSRRNPVVEVKFPQESLVINCGDKVHVVPVWMIRKVARGELFADEELQKAIAVALLDYMK